MIFLKILFSMGYSLRCYLPYFETQLKKKKSTENVPLKPLHLLLIYYYFFWWDSSS